MWSQSHIWKSLSLVLVVLMDRESLSDRDPCVNMLSHRLRSVTVGWTPVESATGCSQTCFKLATQHNLCALFCFSPQCIFKCRNVLETRNVLQSMCSAQVWGCSCLRLIDGNSVVAPVDIIGACHALSILPQYCQYCQSCTNVANIVRLAPILSDLPNIGNIANLAPMLSILHQSCQSCPSSHYWHIYSIYPIAGIKGTGQHNSGNISDFRHV